MYAIRRPMLPLKNAFSISRYYSSSNGAAAPPIDSRFLSQASNRIGKCITFGLDGVQVNEAGAILTELTRDWRDLIAGSEGYLTGKGRRGLYKHRVVWGEMDSMGVTSHNFAGHVNNVQYVRYSESARVEWAANYAKTIDPAHKKGWEELWSPHGVGIILRSIKTDFKFPMTYPDRVTVFHKLRSLPEGHHDAFVLDVLMFSERHRRPVARCIEDIVMYDYRKGTKTTLDAAPFMLDAFRETFKLQEQAALTNGKRVQSITDRLRALETSSWDREGAVEQFGSAKV